MFVNSYEYFKNTSFKTFFSSIITIYYLAKRGSINLVFSHSPWSLRPRLTTCKNLNPTLLYNDISYICHLE